MFAKYASAISTGAFITLALFYAMNALIALQPLAIGEERPRLTLGFHPEIEERPVQPIDHRQKFERIVETVDPDPPRPNNDPDVETVGVPMPIPPTPAGGGAGVLGGAFTDGPLVVVMRASPVYPTRALTQELEGHVLVQFDVLADGSVTNVTIIESSHAVFENAAMKAAEKFRFKARVVEGVPQPSYGIRNLFRFELERA